MDYDCDDGMGLGFGMVDKNKFFVSKRNTKNGASVRVRALSSECGIFWHVYIMEPRASNAWLAASTVGWRYESLK